MSDYTVLVVEDNPLTRRMVKSALESEGYRVLEAGNGHSALAEGGREQPDFIVLDYVLPDTDGLQLLADLRRPAGREEIPALLVTGMTSRVAELRIKAGALTRVMPKPLERSRLVEAVGAQLDARAAAPDPAAPEGAAPAPPTTPPAAALAAPPSDLPPPQTSPPTSPSQDPAADAAPPAPPSLAAEPPVTAAPPDAAPQASPPASAAEAASRERAEMRLGGLQASALVMMRSLTELLEHPGNVAQVIADVLVGCLDAAGLSTGLLYLISPQGRYQLHMQCGLPAALGEAAADCFGHPELMRAIAAVSEPALLPDGSGEAADMLARMGRAAALVVPFVVSGEPRGVLVMAADADDLLDGSWLVFARNLAAQFGRMVALGWSLSRVAASEERYRALMEQANDGILVLDIDLRILEANRAALKLLDRPREEMIGRLYADFVVPEELEELQRGRESLMAGNNVRVPVRHLLRADGSRVPIEVSVSLVRIRNDSTVFAILHDITERRRLEAKLQHAQRMESVGRLAGGVAHEFNNLLTLILGYGNLVLHSLADRPALRGSVEAIVRAGEGAAALTRQLLAFSRRQVLEPALLDLNDVVRELAPILRRLLGDQVELAVDLDAALATVRADAGQVEQVLMNLAANARDAMPHGGTMTISTRNHPAPAPAAASVAAAAADPAAPPLAAAAAPQVVVAVSDTGHGIDSGVMPHIFEPFFTTKGDGTGTGLGLATVYGIVHQSGGRVEVTTHPGEGTTFSVYLPGAGDLAPLFDPGAISSARGTETILIAEDEALIRALAREILEDHGYQVLEAAGTDEALQLAAAHNGPIHLLLTDVIMLGRSGVDLAQTLLKQYPDLRIVYMSGYADRSLLLAAHGADSHTISIVQKPFDPRLLAQQVRAVLDQPS